MKKSYRWMWAVIMMLFMALLVAGCSSDSGGPNDTNNNNGPGVPAKITLSAVNSSVAINGMITVSAIVVDEKGRPVADNTAITLAKNSGTGSVTITPSSQVTLNGKATFVISGLTAGTVNLIAQSSTGGAIATNTLTVVNTAPQLTLSAQDDQTTIQVGQTVTISATVTESNGTLVADGTEITFSLSDQSIASLDFVTAETTDGIATVQFTGKAAGTETVTATYGTGTGMLTMTVQAQSTSPPASITLTSTAVSVQAGSTATISALVKDSNNQSVVDGTAVAFSVDSDSGAVSPLSSTTSGGKATTTFTAKKYGQVVVTATSSTVTATITINVTANVFKLSIATSKTSIKTDNRDSATITATALDQNLVPVVGVPVSFSASAGQISAAQADTDAKGEASIALTSGAYDKSNQTVNITATAPPNITKTIPVQLTGTTITLTVNNTSLQGLPIPTSTSLTATVKDGGGTVIFGADVAISQASVGSASVLLQEAGGTGAGTASLAGPTDVTGKFTVTVTGNNPGVDPVTLTATSLNATATKDITVSGQAFELLSKTDTVAGPKNTFAFNDLNPDTITRSDVGGSFVDDGFATGNLILVSGSASNDGLYDVASVSGTTLTLATTAALTNEAAGAMVTITRLSSDESVITASTSSTVDLWVRSPSGNNVKISTTVGGFLAAAPTVEVSSNSAVAGPNNMFAFNNLNPDTITRFDGGSFINDGFSTGSIINVSGSASNDGYYDVASVAGTTLTLATTAALTNEAAGAMVTIVKLPSVMTAIPDPATDIAHFQLITPAFAGVATVLAEDATNTSVNDTLRVAIAAPSSDATKISIQASPTVIPVSSGGVTNLSSLLITVRNASDQVVSGAPIILTLQNPTGGGEYISPTLVYTDSSGQAESTLYSGSLVSNSGGVTCVATIVDTGITDSINVVIGGNASSVSIGAPTQAISYNSSVYKIPMTVIVADSNGNPVNGATVNLSVWPLGYYCGIVTDTGPAFWYCFDGSYWVYPKGQYYPNEDKNRNEILDGIEDIHDDVTGDVYPAHGNGVLDPAKSTAGTVPATVITDANGVGEFDYYWQKMYSTWTRVEIRASVVVYGSETIAVLQYGPTWLEADKKYLPASPWGSVGTVCP